MSLQNKKSSRRTDAEKVRDFQRKIYRKAKAESTFKFYVLYDKVREIHFLLEAYKRVKANKGSPGIDGVTFEEIDEDWLQYLLDIQEELEEKRYRPSAVKRVHIPKGNGKTRPLGIPTIKDRIVQMSCKMVIEPIFEADFEDESYGFRPKRSASQAIIKIKENLKAGKTEVFDADLSAYFDTIPHSKLLKMMGLRISDKNILHLIKMWLKAPICEDNNYSGGKGNKRGTPQGGVISPLLANIYLNYVDKIINNHEAFKDISIVRYADDFVLMSKNMTDVVIRNVYVLINGIGLKINEEKSRKISAYKDSFDFLGFTFRARQSKFNKDKKYWEIFPRKKSVANLKETIKEELKKGLTLKEDIVSKRINIILQGWLNYFNIPKVSYLYSTTKNLRLFLKERLFRYRRRKSQRYKYRFCRNTFKRWVLKYGFTNPEKYLKMLNA